MMRAEGDPSPEPGRVRVGISYSHESAAHKGRVLWLANSLRERGVDADIDQYHPAPAEGWPNWMMALISESDFVLVVCTPVYLDRVTSGPPSGGGGEGSRFEALLISQEIFERRGRNEKFVPVVFSADDVGSIPPWLRPYTRYDLSTEQGFHDLYRLLTGQRAVAMPELGEVVAMPSKEAPGSPHEEGVVEPSPLPEWHVDLVVNRHSEGGPTQYCVVWRPGIGFVEVEGPDNVLLEVQAAPLVDLDAASSSIRVFDLPENRLRFDFEEPFTPVSGFVHRRGQAPLGPSAKGGGATHYLEFRLDRLTGPSDG
jgi:hypothetical protein